MSFADKLKKFTNDAVEKGKGLAEQGKLSLENQKQLDAIKHAQQLIGAYVAENNLLAEADGSITAINCRQGDNVLQGDVLIVIG